MPKDVHVVGSTAANKVFDLPVTLHPGQVNTLSFSQDSISSMQLLPKGELEISFRDGSRLVVENFDELANSAQSCGRDTLIQLSDNTIIYPDDLKGQLAQGPVNFVGDDGQFAFDVPKPGQVVEANIEAGREYHLNFDMSGASAAQAGQNLILTFPNGGVLILNNYFAASNTELPPVLTVADGSTVDSKDLLTSCKLVEIPTVAEVAAADAPPQTALREAAPNVEPAAGEEAPVVQNVAKIAATEPAAGNDLANIEPAAGDAGAQPTSSSRGYGFSSAIDPASFNTGNPIGPIDPTALNYRAPQIPTIPMVPGTNSPTPPIDYKPVVESSTSAVDETHPGSTVGTVFADYGHDDPGSLSFNHQFSIVGSTGPTLSTCSGPVVVSVSGNTYTGTVNGQPVFTLVLDPATGQYTFTQYMALTHADSSNPDDVISLTFGVTATDADGDTANTTITIRVHDDGPIAADDTASVGSDPLVVDGNVLTNDHVGNDGNGHVVSVTFNGTTVAVPAVGSVTVVGDYGTLLLSADGTYHYTSSNTALGTDRFTYTMADCDGDQSKAILSVAVTDLDVVPVVAPSVSAVDETSSHVVSGAVSADFGVDAPGSFGLNNGYSASGSVAGGTLTSNGVPVVVALVGGSYVGTAGGQTVFTLTLNPTTGQYVFTQSGQLDHGNASNPDDVLSLTFGVTVTDGDGDTANTTITINVHDDGPVAVNDSATIPDDALSVSGNVTANDHVGYDQPGFVVSSVSFNGTSIAVPAVGTVTINGTYGSLVISHTGAYTYTSYNTALGSDEFHYVIKDQDGDTASATLNLTVGDLDTVPTLEVVPQVVDESLVDESGTQAVSGTVVVNFGADGPGTLTFGGSTGFSATGSVAGGALTSNGVPVVVTQVGNQYVGTAGGHTVFEITLNPDNTYDFHLYGQLDHADPNNPDDVITLNFTVVATDSDGDTASGIIQINVHDDAPIAVNDVAYVNDPHVAVTGNVTSNDTIGEDMPGYVVKEVTFNGTTVTVPVTGSITVNGAHGSLVIDHTGAYTYSSFNNSTGSDLFTYTIVDQDGDKASATLTVTVNDIDEQPCVTNAQISVDETVVDDAGSQTINGALSVDFRGDGPGTVNPVSGSFSSGGSLKGGALTSNGVAVAVSLSGDTYTGKAGEKVIFTLTINDDGSYTYKQLGQLDHADGTNPNDVITLNFGFVATDADGDTANGTLTVRVLDDAPVAVNDVATLSQAPGSVSGNVTSNDDVGEDEPGYVVKEVSFGGSTVAVPVTGTVTIAGAHGTLTISHTGAYTYTGSSVGSDLFTYTIVDQDGDKASATLTVTVNDIDEQPTVISDCKLIDETDLGPITVNGTVSPDYHGDGPGAVTALPVSGVVVSGNAKGGVLTSSGVAVVITLVGDTYTGKAGDTTVFTLKVNVDGTYSFKLYDNLDHSITTNHDETLYISFPVQATDADGDSVAGTIKIGIDDDGPVAVNDHASVPANQHSVSGDVDLNDDIGSDYTANGVAFVKYGTTTYTIPVGGTVSIDAQYGTLVIGSNGAYTYTAKDGTTGGTETFTYTLCDTDQDTATANLVIDVAPRYLPPEPPCVTACDTCVMEDGCVQLTVGASPTKGDGNEVITLSIAGFKPGWTVDTSHSGGTFNSVTGIWSITLAAGASYHGGPVVYPPANSDADLNGLVVKAVVYDPDSGQSAQATTGMSVVVDAVADQPILNLHDVYGVGSSTVALSINVGLRDTDGSEVIKEIRIEGMPFGFELNHGTYDPMTGRWVLSADQLHDLQVTGPSGYEGQFSFLVTAVSQEKNLSGEECTLDNNLAYNAGVVTVSINDGHCSCDCAPDTGSSSSVNVSVTTVNSTTINGSESYSSTTTSYSSTTTTTTSSTDTSSHHFNPIVIKDFNVADGDVLDLSGLVEVQDVTTAAIHDFVFARTENGNTIISVDSDGTGTGASAQDVVVLQGVTNVHVEDIVRLTTHDQSQSGFGTA